MNGKKMICLACMLVLATACKPVCPPDTVTTLIPPFADYEIPEFDPSAGPIEVEIQGKMTEVDRVIHGPICNDNWEGKIYVACDVHVAAWEEEPLFLRECDLNIKEDTIVYVAQHNDEKYIKGCSCHE